MSIAGTKCRGDALDALSGRVVSDEVARKFPGEVICRRGVTAEIRQDCQGLAFARLWIGLPQQCLRSRLMQLLAEEVAARCATSEPPFAAADRPARKDLGEGCDVRLRIAAVDSQRVQLEDLARQVLVDPDFALRFVVPARELRDLRVRPGGGLI